MPFNILPQAAPNQAHPELLPSQRAALVRELQAAAPWLSEREALSLLVSDPSILLRKDELRASGQAAFLLPGGLEEAAGGGPGQAASAPCAASGRAQVKGLARQSLNPSGPVAPLNVAAAVAAMMDPPTCITGGQSANTGASKQAQTITQPQTLPQTQTTTNTLGALRGVTLRPDWLQFTVKCPASDEPAQVERLKKLLGPDWQALDGGMLRYQSRVKCGSIMILWAGVSEGMGVHVQISGMGVSELEARGVTDWREWLAARVSEGSRFARTDFAFDVRDGSLTVEQVEEVAKDGRVSSHFDSLEPVLKFDGKGNVTDRGFNFGHRAADTSVVFYDKALEQRKKRLKEGGTSDLVDAGAQVQKQKALEASWASEHRAGAGSSVASVEVPAGASGEFPYTETPPGQEGGASAELWTRCELRNRNKRAQALVERIISEGWQVVAGVLAAALDLKERGEQTQRCRWPSLPWWVAFLDGAEKARLVLDPVVRTLEGGMAALERQYGPLLAACGLVVPNFWEWARGVADRRLETLSGRHWCMVAAYVERCDAPPTSGRARRVVPDGAGGVMPI